MRLILSITALTILAACPEPETRTVGEAGAVDAYGAPAGVLGPDGTYVQAPTATGSIADDPNRIVLSDYTQEEQKRDREAYAAQLDAIASQRLIVNTVDVPQASTVNVAQYARSATNALGAKVYSRSGKRGSCAYPSPYEAQRAFLEAGGPNSDPKGLDPDGDGYACKFDPSIYRALR